MGERKRVWGEGNGGDESRGSAARRSKKSNPRTTPWSLFAAVLDVADVITSLQDEDVAMVGDLPFLLSSLFP